MSTNNIAVGRDIRDRYGPRPIFIKEDYTPAYILISITIVIILAFWIFIVFIVKEDQDNDDPNGLPPLRCVPGQCLTNLSTGIKICPLDSNRVLVGDAQTQVCNSPFSCDNPETPYALLSDGSTNLDGQCELGVTCPCLHKPQCANYVLSVFNVDNGNQNQPLTRSRTVFVQSFTSSNDGRFNSEPPLQYDDVNTQFCSVENEWVGIPDDSDQNRLWPSICPQGTLAYVPSNPLDFDVTETELSCVPGSSSKCEPSQVPYWDNRVNSLCCFNPETTEISC